MSVFVCVRGAFAKGCGYTQTYVKKKLHARYNILSCVCFVFPRYGIILVDEKKNNNLCESSLYGMDMETYKSIVFKRATILKYA